MALVKDIVARFRVEASDHLTKMEAVKAKNREAAQSLLDTAGSADQAIAALNAARGKKALGDFGIDPRQVSGISAEIRKLASDSKQAVDEQEELAKALKQTADRAGGLGDITDSIGLFSRGDFLAGFEKFKKGMAEIQELGLDSGVRSALIGAGVFMAAEALANATTKAVSLRDAIRSGEKSAGDAADELLATIPILGQAYTITKNLIDLASNGYDVVVAAKSSFDYIDNVNKSILSTQRELVDFQKKWADGTVQMGQELKARQLELAGMTKQAAELRIKMKFESNATAAADEVAKTRQALEKQISDAYAGVGVKDGKGLDARVKDARRRESENLGDMESDEFLQAAGEVEQLKAAKFQIDRIREQIATLGDGKAIKEAVSRFVDTGDLKELDKVPAELAARIKKIKETADVEMKANLAKDGGGSAVSILGPLFGGGGKELTAAEQDAQAAGKRLVDKLAAGMKERLTGPATAAKEWVENFRKEGEKAAEKARQSAQRIREANKTELDKFNDRVDEAVALKKSGKLTNGDIDKMLTKDAVSLQAEAKRLSEGMTRDVYSLPDVADVRQGSALYAPPSKTDEESLKRLIEITTLLQAIRDKADKEGIVIEEITGGR